MNTPAATSDRTVDLQAHYITKQSLQATPTKHGARVRAAKAVFRVPMVEYIPGELRNYCSALRGGRHAQFTHCLFVLPGVATTSNKQ